jgi:hypothetical protein
MKEDGIEILDDIVKATNTTTNDPLRKVADLTVEGKFGTFLNEDKVDYTDFNKRTTEDKQMEIDKYYELENAAANIDFNGQPYGNSFTRTTNADEKYISLTVYKEGDDLFIGVGEGADVANSVINSKYNALMESHKNMANIKANKINVNSEEIKSVFLAAGIDFNNTENNIVDKFINEDKSIYEG